MTPRLTATRAPTTRRLRLASDATPEPGPKPGRAGEGRGRTASPEKVRRRGSWNTANVPETHLQHLRASFPARESAPAPLQRSRPTGRGRPQRAGALPGSCLHGRARWEARPRLPVRELAPSRKPGACMSRRRHPVRRAVSATREAALKRSARTCAASEGGDARGPNRRNTSLSGGVPMVRQRPNCAARGLPTRQRRRPRSTAVSPRPDARAHSAAGPAGWVTQTARELRCC